ncbi:hypothetical protein TNCV_1636771 [Trichonephila clavipes]|nr:hypothetical protein TNCV_1636771 [Trichonephila clavipes]
MNSDSDAEIDNETPIKIVRSTNILHCLGTMKTYLVQQEKRCAAFHSRWESITCENPTSFPEEDTTMPYSGLEPEPPRLQAEGHIHHTGWTAQHFLL